MTTMLPKYTLSDIHQIVSNGFQFVIPNEVVLTINRISTELSREPCIRNPTFNSSTMTSIVQPSQPSVQNSFKNRKRKNNREASDDEWKSAPFQSTVIEQKVGIDANVDKIRLYLNKVSDKTYLQMKDNILAELNIIYSNELNDEENTKLCNILYDFSASNKFYSRIFAELYSELITRYRPIRDHFQNKMTFENAISIYNNIEYADPDVNYDLFCTNNKLNEKRRSNTQFYVNLAINGLVTKEKIIIILAELLKQVVAKIQHSGNKPQVDELIENIAILYSTDILETVDEDESQYMINDETITSCISNLADPKSKKYPSLSNKSIFKLMDLIEA
jgi:hypothetical protein